MRCTAPSGCFGRPGTQKSSLNILLKGMGIQKGSFYATFGSKHKVLVEALQLYIQERSDSFLALKAGVPPLTALRRHLDEVLRESIGPDRFMGCFLVNCATELAPKDRAVREIVSTTLRAHARFYESLLEEAKAQGVLAPAVDSVATASALLGLGTGHAGLRERRRIGGDAPGAPASNGGPHRVAQIFLASF